VINEQLTAEPLPLTVLLADVDRNADWFLRVVGSAGRVGGMDPF
jgi:hypothetical protein